MSNLIDRFNLVLVKSVHLAVPFDLIAFEHSIQIYINKPQVINKWVAGSIISNLDDIDSNVLNLLNDFKIECREFISKSTKIFTNLKYLIVFGDQNKQILFKPIANQSDHSSIKYASVNLTHLFQFDPDKQTISLYIESVAQSDDKIHLQIKWLEDNLMSKLISWCVNVKSEEYSYCAKLNTLTLYENMVNDYVKLYQELKEIYWNRFECNWFEITNTNPEKFIHEDIAIATYFILVWKHFNLKVNKFVDLGCGNGLLVYILVDQGFSGYGIDMRRRRVWQNDFYLKLNVKLEERTINPQTDIYEDCDWLIGNHSDELSPWLPIIAKRTSSVSNLKCNFLLIPCCFFDFYNKFDVKQKGESRYDTYLNYLEKIFKLCNFKVLKDKLRIPSTRNICFISLMKECEININESDLELKTKLDNMFTNSSQQNDFKPRDLELENKKSTRNCTKNVEFELKTRIVKTVLGKLLNEDNPNESQWIQRYDGSKWNSGQIVELTIIASLFDQQTLNKLKQECGGIKTLLKNYHQLFEIVDKDKVKIKIYTQIKQSVNKHLKTKECMFEIFHPNGCLQSESECSFIHKTL